MECLPTLAAWLESHPFSDDPEAWLFPNMKHVWKGGKYSYEASDRMLKRAVKSANLKRRIYWHLFRHSAATRSAKYMTDAIIKDRYAWSPTSKMPARYTHLNVGVDANNAYLKAHGIEPEEEDQVTKTDEIFQKNGWLVKNIGIRENPIGTVAYLLSHAGIKKRTHTVTWFGDLSYCKLKIPKLDFKVKCPECDNEFQRLICFVDGRVVKPPPIPFEFSDNPEGWKYFLDHVHEGAFEKVMMCNV